MSCYTRDQYDKVSICHAENGNRYDISGHCHAANFGMTIHSMTYDLLVKSWIGMTNTGNVMQQEFGMTITRNVMLIEFGMTMHGIVMPIQIRYDN